MGDGVGYEVVEELGLDHPSRAWRAYGQSKLANLLFTSELQRRLTEAGSSVLATAAHPGYAATNLQFHSGRRLMDAISVLGNRVIAQDEDGGARPTLYAALADIPGNSYAGPGGFMEQRGPASWWGERAARRTPSSQPGCGRSRSDSPECASRSARPPQPETPHSR